MVRRINILEQCDEFISKYGAHPFNGERSAFRGLSGKQKVAETDTEAAQASSAGTTAKVFFCQEYTSRFLRLDTRTRPEATEDGRRASSVEILSVVWA